MSAQRDRSRSLEARALTLERRAQRAAKYGAASTVAAPVGSSAVVFPALEAWRRVAAR